MNDIEVMQYFLQRKADKDGNMRFGNITVDEKGEMKVSVHQSGEMTKSTFDPDFFLGIKSAIGRPYLIEISQYSCGCELIIKCQDLYVVTPPKKK